MRSAPRPCAAMVVLAALTALPAVALRAQSPAARLDAARTLVRNGEYDSATAVLNPVFQNAATTTGQRSRAFLLSAAALFSKENLTLSTQARAMLQLAVRADSSVRVDDELNTDVPGIRDHFEAVRRELYPPQAARAPEVVALTVQPAMLSDTTLPAEGGRYPIAPRPNRRARAIATIVHADAPSVVVWADTLHPDSAGPLAWNLRGRDAALVPAGAYAVQVWAVDPASGERSATVERTLRVARAPVDTAPVPSLLTASAFAPETLQVKHGSPGVVVLGAGLGAAAAFLPEAFARSEVNEGRDKDGTATIVGGAIAVAGLVGFLAGHRATFSPENARRNAELRQQNAAARSAAIAANESARNQAPVRVRLEGATP